MLPAPAAKRYCQPNTLDMIKKQKSEEWKPLLFDGYKNASRRYAVSNLGRVGSYKTALFEDGKIITGSKTAGYPTLNLHSGNISTLFVHREIAFLFLPKRLKRQKYVIHLNHNKADNRLENLKWATFDEMMTHQQKSPAIKAYRKIQANKTVGHKLTADKVRTIKKVLTNKKRKITLKALAAKYGVSEMTIYRIQSGENWSHIKI